MTDMEEIEAFADEKQAALVANYVQAIHEHEPDQENVGRVLPNPTREVRVTRGEIDPATLQEGDRIVWGHMELEFRRRTKSDEDIEAHRLFGYVFGYVVPEEFAEYNKAASWERCLTANQVRDAVRVWVEAA